MTAPAAAPLAEAGGQVGVLAGIARHARPGAPMERIERAEVTLAGGIGGDYRGGVKGSPYRRQVTLIERSDWEPATAAVDRAIGWEQRRANLLVDGLDLPQTPGALLVIGEVVLEVTRECDPCHRMEALASGLFVALVPDWRGGACSKVVRGGHITVGDVIRVERA